MEDYSIEEMHNINDKILLAVEDNQEYILENIVDHGIELMPLRFSYDLSKFSDFYLNKTKKLFAYYSEKNNPYQNELLRVKKHFKHFMRLPNAAYIPNKEEYYYMINILNELKVEVFGDLEESVSFLNK